MNVVLIVIDTLRADHLSRYGYERPTSPNLDKLAREGVLFENCSIQSSGTHPGFTTLMTGRSPVHHGVIAHCGFNEPKEGIKTLPEMLQGAGYKTGAVDNLPSTWHSWFPEPLRGVEPKWFARGWDDFRDYGLLRQGSRETKKNAGQITEEAFDVLEKIGSEQFFLFLHYWDPHTGYFPPPPFDRIYYVGDESDPKHTSMAIVRQKMGDTVDNWHAGNLRHVTDANYVVAQYDGAITYCDYQLGRLFVKLKEMGIEEETLIIVTADHGENMLDHTPYFGHGGMHSSCLHVPLIMKHPKRLPAGNVVKQLVGHVDIIPTIFGLIGREAPQRLEGMDLTAPARGEKKETRDIVFSTGGPSIAAYDGRYRLAKMFNDRTDKTTRKTLYDTVEDPDEQKDVAGEHPEVVARLSKAIDEWVDALMEEAGRTEYPWVEQKRKEDEAKAKAKDYRPKMEP